jgi:autotransporter-associated beta strand protein
MRPLAKRWQAFNSIPVLPMNPSYRRPRRLVLTTSIAALLGTGFAGTFEAQAQVLKANNTDNLNLTSSWVGGVVPGAADLATWDSTVVGANSTLLGADLTWGGISITNPGGLVAIGGTNRLTLSGATGINLSTATQDLTINSDLAASGSVVLGTRTLTLGGASSVISGVISGTSAATSINVTGGKLLLTGANSFSGQLLIGAGGLATGANNTAFGANGVGNETIVSAGGTLDVGGSILGAEIVRIAGAGVGGRGALTNSGLGQIDALQFVALTGNATINASGQFAPQLSGATATSYGRLDIRTGGYSAGANNLNLGGFTLTKTGGQQFSLVNAEVNGGNIVVNEGLFSIEADTRFVGAPSAITVNSGGRLGFFSLSANAIIPNITVAGGSIGETSNSSAAQTLNSAISLTTAPAEFWANSANGPVLGGAITGTVAGGVTAINKRGAGTITLANGANNFDSPVAIHQGTLLARYATPVTGGATPGAPANVTDTPLGSAPTITLAGGTLSIRVDGSNDTTTNNQISIDKAIVVDRAPSVINLDRLTTTGGQNKIIVVNSLTFAPASAANQYSVGQNQIQVTQTNGFRLQVQGATTMNRETVFNVGDITTLGGVDAGPGRWSLAHQGGNTYNVLGGAGTYNALFNLGTNSTVRVGTGFGTTLSDPTATAGTGAIYLSPLAVATFRAPTNIAAGQTIEVVSQRGAQGTVNFELFSEVPTALRALGTGVLGLGSSTGFGDIDLGRIGDGTFRIGSNLGGSGNGTIVGVITAGANGILRMGATGTVTVSGTDRVIGNVALQVGSPLLNGGFATLGNNTAQSGVVILNGANSYTGGTVVNRGSTLRFENIGSVGNGAIGVFGTLAGQQAGGVFTVDGLSNVLSPSLLGGSNLLLDNGALTDTTDINRWGDNVPIALLASTVTHNSRNNNSSTTTEAVGMISFDGGSTVQVNRQNAVSGNISQLIASGLTRTGAGTLEISRSTGTGAGFGAGNFFKISGTAPTLTNNMVAPFMTISDGTRFNNFATYSATDGFVNAVYTNTVKTDPFPTGLTTGTEIVYVDFDTGVLSSTLGDNPIIHALKVGAGQQATNATSINVSGANNTITIRSGGLIVSGDSTAGNFSTAANPTGGTFAGTATINPNLIFNNGAGSIEALINVRGSHTGVIAGTISANGLTKFGPGTLNITANQPNLGGDKSVNQGVLQLFGPTTTNATHNAAGAGMITLNGGQLNVRTANAAGTSFSTSNNGSHILQNAITIAENVPLGVLDVNRSGADTTSTGTFTFNPVVQGPGLRLLGSAGAQGQTFTVSGANYGVTFGNNSLNTFTGNVTINNAVTVTLNNNPTIIGMNPVITKSGAGTLIVGPAFPQPAGITVAPGTQVHVNAGTLELRSILAFGAGGVGGTSIVLNGGGLTIRRDSAATYGGGSAAPYGVTVNGTSTISAIQLSTGTSIGLGLGTLTINGSPTVTFTNNAGVYPNILGSVDGVSMKLNGMPFLVSNVAPSDSQDTALRLNSPVVGGGFVKLGTGHLHLLGANSTYDGGTWVNQGILRVRAFNALGTGPVIVNPGGTIDFNSFDNLGPDQRLIIRGNSTFLPMISVNNAGTTHPVGPTVDTSGAVTGIIGLSNTAAGIYDTPIDMASMYGGNWYLGGISTAAYDARYTATTLGVGAGNVYRLGGGGLAFLLGLDASNNSLTNVLTGTASVLLGHDSGNIRGANTTTFQFVIGGTNDYSGPTTIHRGTVTTLVAANDGTRSGLSNSAVNVFGNLILRSNASLVAGAGSTNAVTLHPGSALHLDNNNATGGVAAVNLPDRLADSAPVFLDGALLDLVGNSAAPTTETIGNVSYDRGARIRVARNGTVTATLTVNSLAALPGKGHTLNLQGSAAGTLGGVDQLIVATGAPAPVNGMVSSSIVIAPDNTFATYGASGFAPVTFDKSINATYAFGSLLQTDKVDVNTAALPLADNPTIYALRTNQNINVASAFSQVTIRSGGLIAHTNTVTIQPDLVFNDGAANIEARIYNSSTLNINGRITAAGVTKFGTGNLSINVGQPSHNSGWVVNSGILQINDLNGLGQTSAQNTVTLNATQTTGGSIVQTLTQSQLTLNRDTGSPELSTFTGGPITVVNEGTLRIAGTNDRNLQSPPVILTSTGPASVGFTLDVPNNRFRGIVPTLTLNNDATIRVFDSGSTADTGRITAGVVESLVGSNVRLNKIGNRTLELPNNNAATFTGGSIVVSQGTVRVRNNGSLGSATTSTTIERNSTLEIDTPAFTPLGPIVQQAGSIERWNREDARSGVAYNLPAGVNLQLNTNLFAARTIGLNGGTIEGFLWADSVNQAVERTIGPNVTINLISESFIGQNTNQGLSYDAGRLPTVAGPFGDNVTGSYLRVEGRITGNNLTKTGLDTVTIANSTNSYGNTSVDMGVLRIGVNNALPVIGALRTRYAGTFDLFGFDQTVAGLGTPTLDPSPGAVGVGSSGRIVNSAITDNVLNANIASDYTYNGTIEQNVALTKSGVGTLRLNGANTYRGATTVAAGTLVVGAALSGTPSIDVKTGAAMDVGGVVGGFILGPAQVLKGGGAVLGPVSMSGTVAPGSDAVGTLTISALTSFNTGSALNVELNSQASFDRLSTNGISLDGAVNLKISLGFTPAENTQFLIVDNTSLDLVGGTTGLFTWSGPEGLLSEGEKFYVGTQLFSITYQGGVGANDVILVAIPEPSSAAVIVGAMGLLALRRRRR